VTIPVEVALLSAEIQGEVLGWDARDFFVPPSFWGAGIGSRFLERWLAQLDAFAELANVKTLQVTLPPAHGPDEHKEQADLLLMYRKVEFHPLASAESEERQVVLQRSRPLPRA
jgi:GNAT superfamily N-acetyltransferase